MANDFELRFIDFGIGYAYGNTIEINKKFLEYPDLYKMILEHEIEHLKHPSFIDTIKIEVKDAFDFKKRRLMKKYLKNETMMNLQSALPIWKQGNQWCCSSFLLLSYLLVIGLAVIAVLI